MSDEYWDFSPEPEIGDYSEEAPETSEPEASEEVVEAEPVYLFKTALDESVCSQCRPLDGQPFMLSEILAYFPDAYEILPDIVGVNVHINCRCRLERMY